MAGESKGDLNLTLEVKNKIAGGLFDFIREIPETPFTEAAREIYNEASLNTLYSNPAEGMRMIQAASGLLIAGILMKGGASEDTVSKLIVLLGGGETEKK